MKAEIKAKWVEALRSGKYKQAKGVLRSMTGGYCCLGVLCDVYRPSGWQKDGLFEFDGRVGGSMLPHTMNAPVGLSEDHEGTLVNMNDDGMSFPGIADWIEANVEATDKTSNPGT